MKSGVRNPYTVPKVIEIKFMLILLYHTVVNNIVLTVTVTV
jgi:hypothetical protein